MYPEAAKKFWPIFFGFYPSKGDVFSSWGSNVRIEVQRGNCNRIISNNQWSSVVMRCRNWGANVGIEEQRGHSYENIFQQLDLIMSRGSNICTWISGKGLSNFLIPTLCWMIVWWFHYKFLSAPQFWHLHLNSDITPPAGKNISFGEVKLKKGCPNFFCGFGIHIKNTFCKKIVPKRPFQPSAVVRAIYSNLYGVATTN